MERIYVFIGIVLFLLLVLLWFCFMLGSKAEEYKEKYDDMKSRFERQTREYNTLKLNYLAKKEALETNTNQLSSAKQ